MLERVGSGIDTHVVHGMNGFERRLLRLRAHPVLPDKMFSHTQPAQRVTRVVKVTRFARFVAQPARRVLTVPEDVLFQRDLVEHPVRVADVVVVVHA